LPVDRERHPQLDERLGPPRVGDDAIGGSGDGGKVPGRDRRQLGTARLGNVDDPAAGHMALERAPCLPR